MLNCRDLFGETHARPKKEVKNREKVNFDSPVVMHEMSIWDWGYGFRRSHMLSGVCSLWPGLRRDYLVVTVGSAGWWCKRVIVKELSRALSLRILLIRQ